jgi:putative toxin-antitoxin system antitoxin component (TIGR02293 family)
MLDLLWALTALPFGIRISAILAYGEGGSSMLRTEALIEALGGRKVLKRRIADLDELRDAVKAGLPYASLEALINKFGLARQEAAAALHLPQRTIARRKKEQKLRADESDRLLRLARVSAEATAVLGSEEKAVQWLRRTNRALGNQAPLKLIDSDIGTRQVEEVLGRIEHGIIS